MNTKAKLFRVLCLMVLAFCTLRTCVALAADPICNRAVSAGDGHSLFLDGRGEVWAWGDNTYGQLGDGTDVNSVSPVQVVGLTEIVAIDAGFDHSLALKADGTVWAWGNNLFGQLGDGTTLDRNAPVQVQGLSDIVDISSHLWHNVALTGDGTVWVWGAIWTNGVLPEKLSFPTADSEIVDVDAGYPNILGLTANGRVYYDGRQLVQMNNKLYVIHSWGGTKLDGIVTVAAGFGLSLGLRDDGTVWAWGSNEYGELGDGTHQSRNALNAVRVRDVDDVMSISVGGNYGLALQYDGMVWAWGRNETGTLGDGTTQNRSLPVQLEGLIDVEAIGAGEDHSLAVKADGTVWAWGSNHNGQLGDGSYVDSTTPIKVLGLPDPQSDSSVAVHRFWSEVYWGHFYTANEAEKDSLVHEHADLWTYEGVAYEAFADNAMAGLAPVYRFYSDTVHRYFYTMNEDEKDNIMEHESDVWECEGVAFYAFPTGQQPDDTVPVYRFWSDALSAYFYTIEPGERDKLINDYADVWTYEGIVWHAYPPR